MKIVEQEEQCGCVVACIATVLGKTYQEIRKDWQNDFEKEGVVLEDAANYLGDMGFSIIHKQSRNYNHKDDHRKEMFKPFAPQHIVRIVQSFDSQNGHVVVMDGKGKLFCPGGFSEKEIRECYGVTDVLGLYK